MGKKKNNKTKQEMGPESGADQNPPSGNNPQSSGNQAKSNNSQKSGNQSKPNDPQSSDNQAKPNNPSETGNQSKPHNPQTSRNQSKPKNPQGTVKQAKSINTQVVDKFEQMSISSDKQQPQRQQGQQKAQKQQRNQNEQNQPEAQDAWPQPSKINPLKDAPNQHQQQQSVPQTQGAWQQPRQQGQKQPQTQSVPQVPNQQQQSVPHTKGAWQQHKQQGQKQVQTQSASQQSGTPKKSPQASSSQKLTVAETSPTTNMPHLLCPYKGPGTRGTKFRSLLETNYLKLIINNMKDNAYHYDVVIEPDKPMKFMTKVFQQFCVNNFPGIGIAFDGVRNAYAPTILSLEKVEREVDFIHPETGGVRKYLVSIKETEDMEIPLSSLKTANGALFSVRPSGDNRKCTEDQTRKLIKVAATGTNVRKDKIMALLNQIKHNQSPIIRGFGLEIDTNFAKVPSRCLDPPKILYGRSKLVEVKNGVWRGEGMPFLIPESANKWAILNANPRTKNDELQDLARMLLKISSSTNLNLAEKPTFVRPADNRNIQKELENAKKEEIRILFCVIPDSGPTYAKIKQLAETRIGVLTQCIKGGTVFRKRTDGSTISNILLKCNAKLNGTNHRLNESPILYEKCMLIGADVTHPSPDQKNIPSVVGVAASHDANAFCYNVCWRLQGPRVEIIQDFRQIMVEHLKFYQQKNDGRLPDKILYYRDGVSEGQFQQVMANEKNAMVQACAEIEQGYEKRVKLTIIVVQKRHHTRFFPGATEIGKNDRRNNNVPAGTIVDHEITHPNENHFYLVSHQSIQGVSKPTKYCILLDEADHSIDDLQGLTYNLCHLFSRCNRSVSYPAPTYYAHLAAYRGRVYIENERLNMDKLTDEWRRRAIRDDIAKVHPMFFV